jgi:RES domain-containing protein
VPACLPPVQPAPHAGRFHGPGEPWPLYASLDRDTMWAEWRHATGAGVPSAEDPRWVCTLDVDASVLDLREPATRRALRVTNEQLIGPWSVDRPNRAALRVAAAARELGVDGFIVPSAAHDSGWNLAVLPGAFGRVRMVHRRRQVAPS